MRSNGKNNQADDHTNSDVLMKETVPPKTTTATATMSGKNLGYFDRVFNVFYKKYELGIFAYDLPCQHLNTKKIEMQCRAADELATTRFFCIDCETFIE